jgi:hypothetical protein
MGTAVLFGFSRATKAEQTETVGRHDEYMVKGVFLYSFGRNIEWPKDAFANDSAPFIIGIVGEDPFGGTLDAIAAKKMIQGRHIVIRRFASPEAFTTPCHLLFVSRSLSNEQQAAIVKMTQGQPTLLVSETPGMADRGATINFFLEGDRILFEINADAARRAGLRMDAKLLSLGRPVGVGQGQRNQ